MPTTTAQITLSSADLTGDALQLTSLSTLTGHASNAGLSHTTGVNRITFASAQSNYRLVSQADYASSAKAHKAYIKNLSTSNSEYVQLEIGGGLPFWEGCTGATGRFSPTTDLTTSTSIHLPMP